MTPLVMTLRLNISEPLIFQSWSGFSVRGMLYQLLRSVEPDRAASIHAGGALASFSVSPLIILFGNSNKVVWRKVEAPSVSIVRFSLFDTALSQAFVKLLLNEGLRQVTLSGKDFPVMEVGVRDVEFEKFLESSQPVKKFRIRFRTPTYFRRPLHRCCAHCPLYRSILRARASHVDERACPYFKLRRQYRFLVFPEPTLLFRSLLRLWSKFSNIKIDYKGFMDWVDQGGVTLSGYPMGLRTFRIYEHPYAKKWVVGFMGTVYYDLPNDSYDQDYARLCDSLLKFGEISNVGGGKTAGLGMIEYELIEAVNPQEVPRKNSRS
ncbi:MAG: CRISPR system precrRNA processing endoribonuclease RAMP protein Cas6 [Candidatus Bathyarchaeia archaeon]